MLKVLDLDDVEVREAVVGSLSSVASGPTPVCVDEHQRVPDILDALKARLNREGSLPGTAVITGSTHGPCPTLPTNRPRCPTDTEYPATRAIDPAAGQRQQTHGPHNGESPDQIALTGTFVNLLRVVRQLPTGESFPKLPDLRPRKT